jgi:predicted PurR-regulated permease PerM
MLGIDRRALRIAWTIFLFALALFTVYKIERTLIVFTLALFLANLLSPIVDAIERFLPQRGGRALALAIVYLAMIGIIVAIAIPVGSRIGQQAVILANRLPDSIKSNPLQRVPLPNWIEPEREELSQFLSDRLQQLGGNILPSLSQAGRQILTGLGSLLNAILVPILSFFFLTSGLALRRGFVELFEPSSRPLVNGIFDDLHHLLSHYIRALILLALATFISSSVFLTLIGVPYAILLAGTSAALEVIPVLGPLTAAIIVVVVAALSGFSHVLWIVVFLGVYRLFQDYVLSPYLMGSGVEMPPLWILFGVLAGDQLAGIPGMFFSVPVIAALRLVLVRVRNAHVRV